jgi:Domain of unknown function (DUF4157)
MSLDLAQLASEIKKRTEASGRRAAPSAGRSSGGQSNALAPPEVSETLRRPAPSLDQSVREEFEHRFRHDFAGVRIHAEPEAGRSAAAIGARAYTVGQHVVLGSRFASETAGGRRRTLAHELAHVVQQQAQRIPARIGMESSGAVESEADAAARAVEERRTVPPLSRAPVRVQCQPTGTTTEEETVGRAGVAVTPLRVAGRNPPDAPYKIIRLAWTLDDGPTAFTQTMRRSLGTAPGTWFIMRSKLGAGSVLDDKLEGLRRLQASGHEIGIHAMHPTIDHHAWFPVRVNDKVPQAYSTTAAAMRDLEAFATLLRGASLRVSFGRIPGGAITEVASYLASLGESGAEDKAREIIEGRAPVSASPAARRVASEFQSVLSTLTSLGVHLWGGGAGTREVAAQSWEAESSGSGLTDDVTGRFQGMVDEFSQVHRERSLIILAHDTNQPNAEEVGRDIAQMESYAATNGVRVEYYRLSDLYRVVRHQEP